MTIAALWWGGVLALLYAVYAWVGRRDWRFGLPVVGVAATWLPWLRYDDRPIFSFYAVATIPFTVIAVTLLLGRLVGGQRASYRRRMWGTAFAGAFVVLVLIALLTGEPVTWAWLLFPVALLVVAAALLAVFLVIESRVRDPLMPLRLFRIRSVAVSNVIGVLWAAAMFASLL